ncbi:hypothetical protein [Fluviicola sp.]|uniref:hypothetical protein n=1 Tax=Fluviicola sp. TaxID=1917219 RepID=UPI0031DE4C02
MSIQKTVYVFILTLALTACTKGKPIPFISLKDDFIKHSNTDFSGKYFFLGPEIDSANMQILAPCDCCASNMVFVNDSLFVFESLCLEEDVYSKGKYCRLGNLLLLEVQTPFVSEIRVPGTDLEETWEVRDHETNYVAMNISELNSQLILSIKYEGGTDYGMEQGSSKQYISELKKQGVWNKLKLSIK